jgi:short-subunit dehydrogenase
MTKILITGASEGIGLAVAKQLAAAKDNELTLVARNEEKLRQVLRQLPGEGHQYLLADLSRDEDIGRVADHISTAHYDVLINNAGVGMYGEFTQIPLDDQLRMMRLNMNSLVVLSHRYLSLARNGDVLVNTASFLASAPLPGAAVYSATKAFVSVLSETLWWEYKTKGVYVLGFSPGVTSSNFHDTAGASLKVFPAVLLQSPNKTAQEMIAAIERRQAPSRVGGAATRFMLLLYRFLNRRTVINMMGRYSPAKNPLAVPSKPVKA